MLHKVLKRWKSKCEKSNNKHGFYETIRLSLLICRYMILLPISGLQHKDSQLTRCTWKSLYTPIYIISIFLQLFVITFIIYDNILSMYEINRFFTLFYQLVYMVSVLALIEFSRTWSKMMMKIEAIEISLPSLSNVQWIIQTSKRILVAALFLAAVEHLTYILYTFGMTRDCFVKLDDEPVRAYFVNLYAWYFEYMNFNYISAIAFKISNIQYSFMWAFVDILIILPSFYLKHRFEFFNHNLFLYQKQLTQNGARRLPWTDFQEHYTKLMRLVKIVDRYFSMFVFLSFGRNLVFILQQMFFILNKIYKHNFVKYRSCLLAHSGDIETVVYLVVSMTILIGRTLMVSFMAADVHSLSRKPLYLLHIVPAFAYDYDLQRFIDQVYYSKIGLSGLGFFFVTRAMILTVFATLMTYELVLLQF